MKEKLLFFLIAAFFVATPQLSANPTGGWTTTEMASGQKYYTSNSWVIRPGGFWFGVQFRQLVYLSDGIGPAIDPNYEPKGANEPIFAHILIGKNHDPRRPQGFEFVVPRESFLLGFWFLVVPIFVSLLLLTISKIKKGRYRA